MPTTVKTGWLQDKNGDKFAPKTLTSQVQTSDGTLIEDKIKADIDAVRAAVNPESAAVGQTIAVKSVDENGKPTEWEAVDFPECDVTSVNGQTGDVQTRLLVTITKNEDGTYASSHTPQEIYAATQAGAVVEASDANGSRYSLYACNERAAQFLTMGVRGSSGKRILYTETFVISGDKVGKGTTETPIPVAPVPMVGATASAAGTAGLVPKPAAGEQGKYLKGDGTWANIDCVQNPNTAEVGQVITVKAIDENGKVTETVGSNLATDEDTMDLLSELGVVAPVTTSSGEVLINNAGEIYTL